jgi:hypothetical protein
MHCLQALAIAVTSLHLALLLSVYFGRSMGSGAYVSTELGRDPFFAACVSVLVLAEAALGGAYTLASQGTSASTKVAAVVLLSTAVAAWASLATYPESTLQHAVSAAVYIAATAVYSLAFISHAGTLRAALVIAWTCSTVLAIAFGGVYYASEYKTAGYLEWAAFVFYAATLLAFYAFNPPDDAQHHHERKPESARPLLGP